MASRYMVPPQPPPDLKIPHSDAIVKVSCIDSTTSLKLPMAPFLQPNIKGKEFLTGPAFAFLIRHSSGKQILFDLGTRKDWQNLPTLIVDRITSGGWTVTVDKNISTILTEHSIPVSTGAIDAVIWSHHHWDHVGDMSTFPKSTSLVVGPGFQAEHLPGFPDRPDAAVMAEDFGGRTVAASGRTTTFGDGSFYLVDTPGHSVGHICGLARTTGGDKSTFVFMGGDACHHGGEFRPSQYLPLPEELEPSPVPTLRVCPGSLLTAFHRSGKATEPYYEVTPMFAHDLGECNWTIDGVEEFDAQGNVLVLIAHDDRLEGEVEMFPRGMNDWCEKGVKERVKWRFLRDFAGAVEV
ncbi:hypothetical protein KVT40_000631 [Elsinoe batatas]|uniref:Metallo-beta-lactamase domain-containing protein n=1 Tax=Elsinoe batatas TaxID=2601811 RepID=A0A8K0LBP4_9PEZI|nr:hypothetical protein KVT40_000631 [Elsinoe batatas]